MVALEKNISPVVVSFFAYGKKLTFKTFLCDTMIHILNNDICSSWHSLEYLDPSTLCLDSITLLEDEIERLKGIYNIAIKKSEVA